MTARSLPIPCAVVFALWLAACGGDDGGEPERLPLDPCGSCDPLFADWPESGSVDVLLVPSPAANTGVPSAIPFTVLFPPDTLTDAAAIRVANAGGDEIASRSGALLAWPGDRGVRAVLVWVELALEDGVSVPLTVDYGVSRTLELSDPGAVADAWADVAEDDYAVALAEPPAYAVYSPDVLSQTLIAGRIAPLGQSGWSDFEASLVGSSRTAINDVPPEVTMGLIDYETEYAVWLFDRASNLFGVYARTGEVEWLRHAHRAAQFYQLHVNDGGYFDLKDEDDLKYSYGQPELLDLALTGAPGALDVALRVADAGESWDEVYTEARNFWTERHQTYALLAAVSAWELTGDSAHRARADAIVSATLAHIEDPPDSMPRDGCPTHTFRDHEGDDRDEAVCSPWMSALLADAVWRYYLLSRSSDSLSILANLGRFVNRYGTYVTDEVDRMEFVLPYYLASSEVKFSDSGPYDDLEHTCDVASVVARGAYAARELDEGGGELVPTFEGLLASCFYDLDYWHRPLGPENGLAEWRLQPPRKFNWWFKSTHDLPWLAEQVGVAP